MLVFVICPNSEVQIHVFFSGEMHGKVRKYLCIGSFIKKVSYETEDKMQEKMDKFQKVTASYELMFAK